MMWESEEEIVAGIVAQTAEFRYRLCWAGARQLLAGRGIDPLRCLQLSCDQGDDVDGTLILPDGVVADVDFKEDPKTRELISISSWQEATWVDREIAIARDIVLATDPSSFDRQVRDHFKEHWANRDATLPPKT